MRQGEILGIGPEFRAGPSPHLGVEVQLLLLFPSGDESVPPHLHPLRRPFGSGTPCKDEVRNLNRLCRVSGLHLKDVVRSPEEAVVRIREGHKAHELGVIDEHNVLPGQGEDPSSTVKGKENRKQKNHKETSHPLPPPFQALPPVYTT